MSQVCIVFLVIIKFVSVYGYPGETIMRVSPFEVRTVDRYPFTPQFQANKDLYRQQPILHTNAISPRVSTAATGETYDQFVERLNGLIAMQQEEQISPHIRTANERDNEPSNSPYPGPYPRPNAGQYGTNPPYQNSSPAAVTSVPALPKLPLLKPDLSTMFKPTTTKVASKGSGLLGLILSLFSGGGLKMNGIKDLVINSILKPLLVAKGGLKTLISKLTIPLIALLLINLEVLLTVWWLWEDCEPQKAPAPSYSYPKPSYNYNNYNSYR